MFITHKDLVINLIDNREINSHFLTSISSIRIRISADRYKLQAR